mmetsp:Transcript_19010/g.39363  ORF Transcript_19010/g.39363 Transcript_19010/m.39363 type:complete len:209 (-) Transcript_19010:467-1093(-)
MPIGILVCQQLLVSIVPACNGGSNFPLKSNVLEQCLTFLGHGTRLASFAQGPGVFLVGDGFAVSLLFYPSPKFPFLGRHVAMAVLFFVNCQLLVIFVPFLLSIFFEGVPNKSQMVQNVNPFLGEIARTLWLSHGQFSVLMLLHQPHLSSQFVDPRIQSRIARRNLDIAMGNLVVDQFKEHIIERARRSNMEILLCVEWGTAAALFLAG